MGGEGMEGGRGADGAYGFDQSHAAGKKGKGGAVGRWRSFLQGLGLGWGSCSWIQVIA